jgi:hypothetical protein
LVRLRKGSLDLLEFFLTSLPFILFLSSYFSKATFNLETGDQVKSEENTGFLGGIAKAVLSSQGESASLPVYQLGEKNGKILFSME